MSSRCFYAEDIFGVVQLNMYKNLFLILKSEPVLMPLSLHYKYIHGKLRGGKQNRRMYIILF